MVGERAGEIVILLHQQNRHFPLLREQADHALDILDDRRLDALGGLVQDQQLRLHCERAADGKLLLLPAGEVAPAPAEHVLQHREQVENLRRNGGAAALGRQAHQQVFFHRESGKDFASLRHVADAEARARIGCERGDVRAFERERAGPDRHQAHQALQQRGLAHAVSSQ